MVLSAKVAVNCGRAVPPAPSVLEVALWDEVVLWDEVARSASGWSFPGTAGAVASAPAGAFQEQPELLLQQHPELL